MIIQQAVYGASAGHALLKASNAAMAGDFSALAWRTDLPATCPAGVTWLPFFRLVRVGSWMLFAHTRPDEATQRGGMVLSRAALIPIDRVGALSDLSKLAAVLREPWVASDALLPIVLDEATPPDAPSQDVLDLTAAIAAAIIRDATNPAVVAQHPSLDEAIFQLWRRVPPEFRVSLTFNLSFGPEDVHELAIACTPPELIHRWDQSLLLEAAHEAAPDGRVATLLGLEASPSSRSFALEVGLPLNSPKAIAIAMQAAELWRAGGMPPADVQLLRILAERGDSGAGASRAKSVVAKRLASVAPSWAVLDVLAMRNLDLAAAGDGGLLTAALTRWMQDHCLDVPDGFLDVLASWASGKPNAAWLEAIEAGLRAVVVDASAPDALYALLWRAIADAPARAQRILSILEGPAHEKRLMAIVDGALPEALADQVLLVAIEKSWWSLVGALMARSRGPLEALTAAIDAAPPGGPARQAVITAALSEASAAEVVAAAISTRDPVAKKLAAEACVQTPLVLHEFDWKRYEWFELLKAAHDSSPAVFDELPDPVAGMGRTISAQMAVHAIWEVVAGTPLIDLVDVPGRPRAWGLIPAEHVDRILDATAHSWLKQFEQGTRESSELETEPRLATAVTGIAKRHGHLIQALRRSPSCLPRYLSSYRFDSDEEAFRFLSDLNSSDIRLDEPSSRALGQTLLAQGWREAARRAVNWLNTRHDFHALYRECFSLLGLVDKMWVTFKLGLPPPLTIDEAWEVFETEAASLYPGGPWYWEIWSRSGGYNEDLADDGTGREKWRRCMRELRHGLHPGAEALLREMMNDFRHNDTLRQLERQRFWR